MSANLGAAQVTTNQNNKETTINDAVGRMDAALTETLSKSLSGASPVVTLTNAELQAMQFLTLATGTTPSGTATINVPAIKRGTFFVFNNSSIPADVGISGQPVTKPHLEAGAMRLVISDGVNVRVVDGGEAAGPPFDLGFFWPGVMANNQLIARFAFTRTVFFPTNLSGSVSKSLAAANASTTIDVKKNGTDIGDIVFAAAGTVATYTFTANSFVSGDVLSLHGPAVADTTLADVAFTLKGTRL